MERGLDGVGGASAIPVASSADVEVDNELESWDIGHVDLKALVDILIVKMYRSMNLPLIMQWIGRTLELVLLHLMDAIFKMH